MTEESGFIFTTVSVIVGGALALAAIYFFFRMFIAIPWWIKWLCFIGGSVGLTLAGFPEVALIFMISWIVLAVVCGFFGFLAGVYNGNK